MSELSYKIANLQGVGKRERQEDSFVIVNAIDEQKIDEQGLFFAVCDGMGGMADGALAGKTAVASFKNSFMAFDISGNIPAQLKESVFTASSEVEAIIGGDGGSTVVAGLIFGDCLYYVSVGDSFLMLYRDGNLYRLNLEQNLYHQHYMEEIRSGSVDPSDYQERKEAAAITGFIGMQGLDDVDLTLRPIPLRENDIILACSDGIGGVLIESDMRSTLSLPTEHDICKQLEQKLVDYGIPNQDNYTAVIVKCDHKEVRIK